MQLNDERRLAAAVDVLERADRIQVIALGAGVGYGALTVVLRALARVHPTTVVALNFCGSGLLMLPFALKYLFVPRDIAESAVEGEEVKYVSHKPGLDASDYFS